MNNLSIKTRFLNTLRYIFTVPILEDILVFLCLHFPNYFFIKLIPSHYLYKNPSVRKVTRFGFQMNLDISHVVDHTIYFGIKDSNYNLVLNDLKSASAILDIGANIGSTSLFFSSINPTATIIAFEPHPDTFQRALTNLNCNTKTSIILQNYGLGATFGIFKMYELHSNNPGMNRILSETVNLPYKTIEVRTLDSQINGLTQEHIGFIKIDVEGFEKEVLQGGQVTLQKYRPTLFIELDDNNLKQNGSSASDLVQFLKNLGYTKFLNAKTGKIISIDDDFKNCHFDIIVR